MKERKVRKTHSMNIAYSAELILEELYCGGEWFQFPRSFLYVMPLDEAVLLAYLFMIRKFALGLPESKDSDGWFYCKLTKIKRELLFSKNRQTRLFSKLKEKGFIKTSVRGMPPKRFIKLFPVEIWQAIQFAKMNQ